MSSSAWRAGSSAPAMERPVTYIGDMLPDALEAKATRMHGLGRLRGKHFLIPVMADSAMDVMLSLLVGALQGIAVSDTALAVGNMLSREDTDLMIDKLVNAGLAAVVNHEGDRRTVGLTPLGSARMRSFVNDYPDV